MRFPKDTRALIAKAAPNPITIEWPKGEREPKIGRTYIVQSFEEKRDHQKREHARRENEPESCAEVMAGMYARRYGEESPNAPKPKPLSRQRAGSERIYVIDAEIQDKGWLAKVVLYDDPDPIRHTGIKASVAATEPRFADEKPGPSNATETEPEKVVLLPSRRQREEEEDALRIEHAGSVDMAKVLKIEQGLNQRRKERKPAPLQEAAIARAKRRDAGLGAA